MRISPVAKSLDDIFRGNFLRIPRFQRPYSWDKDNISDFWNDLANSGDQEYFMGSTVLFPDGKEKNVLAIVDGQQRLTTITIALSIVRGALDRLEQGELAEGIQALLERKDIDNKLRYVLEHEPKNSFFQVAIQQRRPDDQVRPNTPEERALSDALLSLRKSLEDDLTTIEGDDADKKRVARLRTLRNRLLSLLFISIQLDDEDDAYLIFETLNTRGKDLRISDLLKNLFTRLIKEKTKGHDVAKDTWQTIMARLSSVSPYIDPDTFLLHYWLAEHNYVPKASLFKIMKESVNQANALDTLKALREAAEIYVQVVAPSSHSWAKEERQLRNSLGALQAFRVAQATPLTFAVVKKFRTGKISLASAARTIEYIEKFAFIFNAVTQSRGGGGIANMYARLAQKVTQAADSQAFADVSKEIKDKLVERVPGEDEFAFGLADLAFRSDFTRERALVRYALSKFAMYFGLPAETDPHLLTIEHIWPESKHSNETEYWGAARFGNLLLVTEQVNELLKAKPFGEKKAILDAQNVPKDDYLKNALEWTLASIEERAKHLATIGYKNIWWI